MAFIGIAYTNYTFLHAENIKLYHIGLENTNLDVMIIYFEFEIKNIELYNIFFRIHILQCFL